MEAAFQTLRDAVEAEVGSRQRALDERERSLNLRERALDDREKALDQRDLGSGGQAGRDEGAHSAASSLFGSRATATPARASPPAGGAPSTSQASQSTSSLFPSTVAAQSQASSALFPSPASAPASSPPSKPSPSLFPKASPAQGQGPSPLFPSNIGPSAPSADSGVRSPSNKLHKPSPAQVQGSSSLFPETTSASAHWLRPAVPAVVPQAAGAASSSKPAAPSLFKTQQARLTRARSLPPAMTSDVDSEIVTDDPGSASQLRQKFEQLNKPEPQARRQTWNAMQKEVPLPTGSGSTKVQPRGGDNGGAYKKSNSFNQPPPPRKSFADLP